MCIRDSHHAAEHRVRELRQLPRAVGGRLHRVQRRQRDAKADRLPRFIEQAQGIIDVAIGLCDRAVASLCLLYTSRCV